jgi:hypothetical protein
VKQPIFTEEQKSILAGQEMLYWHHKRLANLPWSGAQAAEAMWTIADIFLSVTQLIQKERDLQEVIRRFQEITNEALAFQSREFTDKKNEFQENVTSLRVKSRAEVRRLRKRLP